MKLSRIIRSSKFNDILTTRGQSGSQAENHSLTSDIFISSESTGLMID